MPTTRTRVVPRALAPIGLGDLNRRAALLTRVDRKYVLGLDEARRVLALVDPASRLLSIDGLDVSAYSTTYYDTPGLDAFSMTARPRRRRFKVRTRRYVDSGQAFLEVKTRGPRGTTIKERQRIAPHEAGAPLTDAHRGWVADRLERVGRPGAAREVEPVLRGSYSRSTLLLPGAGRGPPSTPTSRGRRSIPGGARRARWRAPASSSSRRRGPPPPRASTAFCGAMDTGPPGSRNTRRPWPRSTRSCPPTGGTASSPGTSGSQPD